ncbi:TetR/AcrR family transcriptional regulator [Rhizobium ruizarguesonis]|uniref:TetR/AcrR family transcriptional regulator n=1 Tax=Rhizobium ruizarguesonis TaxID=2081791 RepID=UPI0014450FB2|nr:TetR/AcrR family transcriptional regulator [Rhizobium ruizarguesonis]NKQ85820.1 TetR/AcrR family transcriptional regulator [Rhizobium ruizarguesonis]
MNHRIRIELDVETTHERILDVAEEHFRRIGFQKTTVADIAKCLGMSSANIYRFFPSRSAIDALICNRFFAEFVQVAKLTACIRGSAQTKLAKILALLHQKRKTTFVEEKRVHDLMVAAAGENWEINKAHTDEVVAIIEAIIRDGTVSGEFVAEDPGREARSIMTAFTPFYHPVLVEQEVRQGNDTGARLRDQIAFFIRALGGSATDGRHPGNERELAGTASLRDLIP